MELSHWTTEFPLWQVVSPGEPLGPGQIYDSNRTTLTAALREQGFTPVDLGVARDRYRNQRGTHRQTSLT